MALNELQKAFLRNILINKDNVIDPDTGDPVDWDSIGAPDLSGYQLTSAKDQASGYAGLDGSGKLLAAQLPGAAATDVETAAAVAALSSVYQPLDADLTAIAALTTTSYGRALLSLANQAALQTAVGSGPALASGKVSRTSGDLTTTSTSFVDATGLTVTLTTGARRCLVTFSSIIRNSGGTGFVGFDIAVDGVAQGGTKGLTGVEVAGAAYDTPLNLTFLTDVLSAGSHTIKLIWRVGGGTGTVFASSTTPAVFSVEEQADALGAVGPTGATGATGAAGGLQMFSGVAVKNNVIGLSGGSPISNSIGLGIGPGIDSGDDYRRYSLIAFNTAALAGKTILDAWLELTVTANTNANSAFIHARRVLRNFIEAQVTWNIYSTGNNWGTAGALNTTTDVDPFRTAKPYLSSVMPASFTDPWQIRLDMAPLLRQSIAAAEAEFRAQFGFTSTTANQNSWTIADRSHATALWRPTLYAVYI